MRIIEEIENYLMKRRQDLCMERMTQNNFLTLLNLSCMSRATFLTYKKSGFYSKKPLKEQTFLGFFTILFPLNPENYRVEAINLIIFFRDSLGENSLYINKYIDSNYYIHSINREKVKKISDQFTAFLQSSMFHQYIFSLFNLDTKGYSPSPISRKDRPVEDIIIGKKELDAYMTQTLYVSIDKKKQPLFSTDDGNLDFFDKKENKLLLVTGPGGQGKTTFVKKISEQKYSNNLFSDVFIVPLVDLTTKDLNNSYSKNNLVFEYIKEIFNVNILENEDKKYIIALDGYNEFRTANNKKAVSAITDSINDIISDIHTLERTNISLVITTRDIGTTKQIFPCFEHFKCVVLSGTSQEKYSILKKLCESHGILFETEKGNKTEIGELAEIPMYANMIYELVFLKNGLEDEEKSYSNQPIKNLYSLFFEAYLRRAMQKTESSMSKNNYDRSAYLYFYYVIMPYIAYAKITSKETFNEYSVDETELNGFISDLRNNKYVEVAYENIRHNLFPYVERDIPNINEYELIELFLGEDNIISKDLESHTYKFEHEAWRDFLVALYLKNNIEVLKKHYLDNDSEIALTLPLYLNVNSNTSKLIRQSIGVYGSSEENAIRFYDYFKITTTNLNRLAGVLRFSNLAYDFCEYLQVDLPLGASRENDTLHKVLFACSSRILELTNNPKFLNTIKSDSRIAECVCNVLGKEGEYYRRTKDYQKVFEIVEFCTQISDNNYFIQNQNAKLHLSYHQSVVLQEEIISTPDCFIGKDIETVFQNGLEILKQPVQNGFYLSVNIYGLIITYPAPYLLYNSLGLRIDYNSAFKAYLKTIFESESQGREISYTVRQALGLLIKHGVRLSPDNKYIPLDEWNNDLSLLQLSQCYEKNSIDEATLSFTKDLLKRADGQDLTGLNYLRGCVALFCKEKDKAEEYFKSPVNDEIDLLYKIRLNYEFGYHEDLDTLYSDLCEKIVKNLNGEYDKTHFVYFYLEGKQLELSYVAGAEQEERLDYFWGLETQFGISDLCSRIESIL